MELKKALRERRSIRTYLKKPIARKTLEELVELANWAPSPNNAQNREFVIVTDEKMRKKIGEVAGRQDYGGSAVIVVASRKDWLKKEQFKKMCAEWDITDNKTVDKYFDYWSGLWKAQDAALAVQNLLLAAWDAGIGSCWLGVFDEQKIRTLLGIPETHAVVAVIQLGFFEKTHESNRKKPGELAHWEKW